jgi:hypothetical protein
VFHTEEVVADQMLDLGSLLPETLRSARRGKLVDGMLVAWGISNRRACNVPTFDAATYYYKARRRGRAPLERRIAADAP